MDEFNMDEYKKSYDEYLESLVDVTDTLAALRKMGYIISKPTENKEET